MRASHASPWCGGFTLCLMDCESDLRFGCFDNLCEDTASVIPGGLVDSSARTRACWRLGAPRQAFGHNGLGSRPGEKAYQSWLLSLVHPEPEDNTPPCQSKGQGSTTLLRKEFVGYSMTVLLVR